jgi:hypothetical protein
MVWIFNLILVWSMWSFNFFFHTYMVHKKDVLISCVSCDFKFDQVNIIEAMKQQCNVANVGLI